MKYIRTTREASELAQWHETNAELVGHMLSTDHSFSLQEILARCNKYLWDEGYRFVFGEADVVKGIETLLKHGMARAV